MALKLRVAGGKTGLYNIDGLDPEDVNLPLTDPLNHLPRLKFHSDLDRPKVVHAQTVNVNLPARTNFQAATASYTLFAHGKEGYPFVFGSVTLAGEPISFVGSIPIQQGYAIGGLPSYSVGSFARWIALGADDTNVYVHEYCVASWSNSSVHEGYAALTVPVTVYVTDEILE